MPSTMLPAFAQALEALQVRVGDQRGRVLDVLEDAGRAGAEDQLLGAERRADRGGDGVGVDVEQRAVVVAGQRADHRHQAVVEQLAQHRRVDASMSPTKP
jgi:hypothetical protein